MHVQSPRQMCLFFSLGVLGLSAAFLFTFHTKATFYKLQLFKNAAMFFLFCKDKSWPKRKHHANRPSGEFTTSTKTIIFLRHGESTWNETFNRSKNPIYFIPRICYALGVEAYLLFTGTRDSWFYDASLCPEGLAQANELREKLANLNETDSDWLKVLKGTSQQKSLLVSSNLRRALTTIIVALHDRIQKTEEEIVVLPHLQEISRNADTLSITPPKTVPHPSWLEQRYHIDVPKAYSTGLHVELNSGNKDLSSVGIQRLCAFNRWAFSVDEPVVIASGHSLWFRHYFQEFLPEGNTHPAQTRKIHNGGALAFKISCDTYSDGKQFYTIDPESIETVWKGLA